MTFRRFLSLPLFFFCASFVSPSQELLSDLLPADAPLAHDFDNTVLKITELKFQGADFEVESGTGFCLDPRCQWVATNYHVARMTKPRKIAGEKIVWQRLATGLDDEGAAQVRVATASFMRFVYSRDLALYKLAHPLPHHHGAAYSLEELQVGQSVDVYTYPVEGLLAKRTLIRFLGRFAGRTTSDLLAFDYQLSDGHRIRPGSSGGIVVDHESQKIVGVLSAIADNHELTAFAVPVQSLVDFVTAVQPLLAKQVFPSPEAGISATSSDLYTKLEPARSPTLRHRPDESPAVKLLRQKAQLLADGMRNFIALQSVEWGSGNRPASASAVYEIRILDGDVKFREYPAGRKDLQNLPFPPLNTAIVAGGEWAELPRLVALEPHLEIEQMPDGSIDGRPIKVFRYRGDAEDNVCRWRSSVDLGFFSLNKDVTVSCYGEVWTDEDTNIRRMSEHYELPGKWKDYQAVMTYGWLRRPGEIPRLIPAAIASQAEWNRKTHWCRSQFLHYQVFSSQVRMTMK